MAFDKDAWKKEAKKQMLSAQVSTIRKERGLEPKDLADSTGYEPATIRRIENGTFLPDKGRDIPLANALGVSLDQLWGRKKFEFYSDGNPKLKEHEKVALTLLAPLYKAMSKEGRQHLLDTAVIILRAEGKEAAWDTYEKSAKEE